MLDVFKTAIELAHQAASRVAGGTIVYQRGDDRVSIEATFGRTEYQVETGKVVRLEHTDRDFIFQAQSLFFDGKLTTPKKGDRVTIVESGEVFDVFPVRMSPAISGQMTAQCFRACDPHGYLIRVHTKQVSG